MQQKPGMNIIAKYFNDFTPQQEQQFSALGSLYKEWNEKINVISRKDMDNFYMHHVLHSLSIAAAFQFEAGTEIVDLGTGGGFPGIPLAIYFPEVRFHLADSIAKKLKVVDAVAQTIGLTNITTQHSRIEDIKNRKFDIVVSRAVAPLKDLWKWSRPLLHKRTGYNGLICLKGGDLSKEVQESGLKPRMMEIIDIFREEYFTEKYILYVNR